MFTAQKGSMQTVCCGLLTGGVGPRGWSCPLVSCLRPCNTGYCSLSTSSAGSRLASQSAKLGWLESISCSLQAEYDCPAALQALDSFCARSSPSPGHRHWLKYKPHTFQSFLQQCLYMSLALMFAWAGWDCKHHVTQMICSTKLNQIYE